MLVVLVIVVIICSPLEWNGISLCVANVSGIGFSVLITLGSCCPEAIAKSMKLFLLTAPDSQHLSQSLVATIHEMIVRLLLMPVSL